MPSTASDVNENHRVLITAVKSFAKLLLGGEVVGKIWRPSLCTVVSVANAPEISGRSCRLPKKGIFVLKAGCTAVFCWSDGLRDLLLAR